MKAVRTALAATLVATFLFSLSAQASAAPGDFNTAFSGDGISLASPISSVTATATKPYLVRVAADGSVVAAGTANQNIWVARFTPAGASDTTFSGDGYFELDLDQGSFDEPREMRFDSDGKIVLAGRAGNDAFVLRLAADGSLDSTFSGDGMLLHHDSSSSIEFTGMDLQSDGKIVVASASLGFVQVRRYTATGELDASFSGGGSVDLAAPSLGGELQVEVDPSDRIVLGATQEGSAIRVARLTSAGALDGSFDGDGRLDVSGFGDFRALTVDSLGNVLVAAHGTGSTVVVRLKASDGDFDSAFSGDGIAGFDPSGNDEEPRDIVTVGQYVLVGGYQSGFEAGFVAAFTETGLHDTSYNSVTPSTFSRVGCVDDGSSCPFVAIDANAVGAVAWAADDALGSVQTANVGRLNGAGVPDVGFSGDGATSVSVEIPDAVFAGASATRPDGTTIVAGFGGPYNSESLVLTAFESDGQLDSSFSSDGMVEEDILLGTGDYITGIAADSTNRLYVYGTDYSLADAEVFVLRYNASGTRDLTFGGDGKFEFDPNPSDSDFSGAIRLESDGAFFLAGSSYFSPSTDRGYWLAKFSSSGVQDPSWNGGLTKHANGSSSSGLAAGNFAVAPDGGIAYSFTRDQVLIAGNIDSTGAGRAGFGIAGSKSLGDLDADWNGEPQIVTIGSDFLIVFATFDGKVRVAKISGASGDLVTGFGTAGVAELSVTPGPSNETSPRVSVDGAGRITVAAVTDGLGANRGLFLARLTPAGQPDLSFSALGWRTQPLPAGLSVSSLVAIDRAGLNNRLFGASLEPQSGEYSFFAASVVSDDPVVLQPPVVTPPVTQPDLTACNKAKKKLSALKKTLAKQKKALKKAKSSAKKKRVKKQIKSTNKKITAARKSVKKACG